MKNEAGLEGWLASSSLALAAEEKKSGERRKH